MRILSDVRKHLPFARFHLDHIRARQHGGSGRASNLAWCCQQCNLLKGTNLSGVDPDSGAVVPLFHPRKNSWGDHFSLSQDRIVGLTPIGRATVWLLQMNSPGRLELRAALKAIGEL